MIVKQISEGIQCQLSKTIPVSKTHIILLILLCVVSAFLRVSFSKSISEGGLQSAPDSVEYHFLAVNMLKGHGYVGYQISGIKYDDYSLSLSNGKSHPVSKRPSCSRTPGYPIFLAFVYWMHGIDTGYVHLYQIIFAAITVGMLPFCGYLIGKCYGAVLGMVAAYLLAVYPSSQYAASMMLTECLSEILLTAAFCFAVATHNSRNRSIILLGIIVGVATLVRPGNICVVILSVLFCASLSYRRGLACLLGAVLIIAPWSLWATFSSGHVIALSGNSVPVLVAGINPLLAAQKTELSEPTLDADSLELFWRKWPGDGDATMKEYLKSIWKKPIVFVKTQRAKMKIAIRSIPPGVLALMCLSCLWFLFQKNKHKMRKKYLDKMRSILFLVIPILFVSMVILPSSSVACLLLASSLLTLFIVSFLNGIGKDSYSSAIKWNMVILLGYISMIMISIGHERFVRPFLPIFFLSACLSIVYLHACYISCESSSVQTSNKH